MWGQLPFRRHLFFQHLLVRTRWLFTIASFLTMLAVSVAVTYRHWPEGGMPWLSWTAHAAALTVTVVEVVSRALKIQASAWAINAPLSFGTALKVCLTGDFAAAVTPARSGAEPARFFVLEEAGMPTAQRLVVLFLELFLELWSLALVCLGLAALFYGHGTSVMGLLGLVGGYSTAILALGTAAYFLSRGRTHGPPPSLVLRLRVSVGVWRAVQRALRDLRAAVSGLRQARPARLLTAYACSVVHITGKVAVLPALLVGSGVSLTTPEALAPIVLWPLALFYGGVVVPAPGGGGAIEGAFALTLVDAIPVSLFAASLLWWRFYTYYMYLLIGGLAAGEVLRRRVLVR